MDLVMQQRNAFRKGLKDNRFDKFTKFDVSDLIMFKAAVLWGYYDAKRTFGGIGAVWGTEKEHQDRFFETMAEEIQKLFTDDIKASWHEDLCALFCSELIGLGYSKVTYGQAQKVINMAFKYLFCFDGAENYKAVFDKCHMPLDSYTLSWYRKLPKSADKNARIRSDTKWSSLTKDQYVEIQNYIRICLDSGCQITVDNQKIRLPKQPLYAEFIVWPEEILLKAGNDFMKTLNPNYKIRTSDSMQLMKHILCKQLPKYCSLDICISDKK